MRSVPLRSRLLPAADFQVSSRIARRQIGLRAALASVLMLAGLVRVSRAELDLLPSIIISPSNQTVSLSFQGSIPLPSDMATPNDGSGRLFVTDYVSGAIRIFDGGGNLLATPYHTMAGPTTKIDGDTAFTSIAFHPGFANVASPGYGKFYTLEPQQPGTATATFSPQFSSVGTTYHHQDVLYEYTVPNPAANTIGSFTKREVMRANQSGHNHNFNDLAFDANQLLYISTGDGRNNATERQNAPSLTNVYGKTLRIDPLKLQGALSGNSQYSIPANPFSAMGGSVRKEIFTYGNRNPYRISIDPVTNNLYLAEVGQDNVEEINVVPNVLNVTAGGQNFGWPGKEGSVLFPSFATDPDGNLNGNGDTADANGWTDPILEYDHEEGADIIGGFVYRGTKIPQLAGKYVFADHQGSRDPAEPIPNLARLFYGDLATGQIFEFRYAASGATLPTRIFGVGQDSFGELYVLGLNGVYKVNAVNPPGDFDADGDVDGADFVAWQTNFPKASGATLAQGDADGDGDVDGADFVVWQTNFPFTPAPASAPVPEPNAMLLTLIAAGASALFRKKSSQFLMQSITLHRHRLAFPHG
jgi:glucose/arabinose dehydrogenase